MLIYCPIAVSQSIDTGDSIKRETSFPGNKTSMNSFALKDFGEFSNEWKMVTVRFREDNRELRMIYANPKAYQHLISGKEKVEYPDGAIFAKIAYRTNSDPSFASSLAPTTVRRFQFMVHDSKKFGDTGGWGYALFNSEGKTHPGDETKVIQACHACHLAVRDRGYIFAEPTLVAAKQIPQKILAPRFVKEKIESLPMEIRKYLYSKNGNVEMYEGIMSKLYFQGTVDEIVPTLIQMAIKSGKSSLFLSEDKKEFSLVQIGTSKKDCSGRNITIHQTVAVPEKKGSGKIIFKVIQKDICL